MHVREPLRDVEPAEHLHEDEPDAVEVALPRVEEQGLVLRVFGEPCTERVRSVLASKRMGTYHASGIRGASLEVSAVSENGLDRCRSRSRVWKHALQSLICLAGAGCVPVEGGVESPMELGDMPAN